MDKMKIENIKASFISFINNKHYTHTSFKTLSFLFCAIILYLIYPDFFTFKYWGGNNFNRSQVIRNLALIPLGMLGLYLAVWRSKIAEGQLNVSEQGVDIDRLHKSVELLSESSVHLRLTGVISLHELAVKSKGYRHTVVLVLNEFLQSKNNRIDLVRYFEKQDSYENWMNTPSVEYDSIKAFEALSDLDFSQKDSGQQYFTYMNISLRGAELWDIPSETFYNCDLSYCEIKCKDNTRFLSCDLTGARVIPAKDGSTIIFDRCDVSNLKLEVSKEVKPIINGWHWEGYPPVVADYWGFYTLPSDRRIIQFDKETRIFPTSERHEYYLNKKFGVPKDSYYILGDDPKNDLTPQVLQPETSGGGIKS